MPPAPPHTPNPAWRVADVLLVSLLAAVGLYGLAMAVWGATVANLFEFLGFGAVSAGVPAGMPTDYVHLLQSVIGASLAGWMVLAIALAAGPIRRRERWAWLSLVASILTWFVIDTGYSLLAGQISHAIFNLGFAVLLTLALVGVRPRGAINSATQA